MMSRFRQQLPLHLTLSRIWMAPILMALMGAPSPWGTWGAAVLFVLASLTDWADGHLARKWQVESNAGKFLDPIADKILVLGAILVLLSKGRVDPWMVFFLLGRDIVIGGVRAIAATERLVIAAKPFGKWKTGLQMVGIPMIMLEDALPATGFPGSPGVTLMWVSVVLSLVSAAQYVATYLRAIPPRV